MRTLPDNLLTVRLTHLTDAEFDAVAEHIFDRFNYFLKYKHCSFYVVTSSEAEKHELRRTALVRDVIASLEAIHSAQKNL